jgi:hypothetical protein
MKEFKIRKEKKKQSKCIFNEKEIKLVWEANVSEVPIIFAIYVALQRGYLRRSQLNCESLRLM